MFRTLASALVALGALATASVAVAAREGHYVEHRISLYGSGTGYLEDPGNGVVVPPDAETVIRTRGLNSLHGRGLFPHPSSVVSFVLAMFPVDVDYDRGTIPTSRFYLNVFTDLGSIVFSPGTGTWSGDGLPSPFEAPDYDGEFTATLTISSGSGAFEGASGTVHLRGHLDDYGHWVTPDWPYSPGPDSPMHIDEIEGTISFVVP